MKKYFTKTTQWFEVKLLVLFISWSGLCLGQWPAGMSPANFTFNKNFTAAPSQNNDITQDGAAFRYNLTPWSAAMPASNGQINSMWNNNVFNFRNPFSICFQVQINPTTAGFQDRKTDGFSFNLQRITGATPTAAELSRVGQPGGGMGALCNLSNSDQLIFEFDLYSNSNTTNACPPAACGACPACDVNDSPIAEHISINRDISCTHAQNPAQAGNIMTPVAMRPGVPNYTGFPYANTIRDGAIHNVLISWTPSAPVNMGYNDEWGACPGTGWPGPAWAGCPVVSCTDPGVIAGAPNRVPCYRQGGTFTITVDGSLRVNQTITSLWTVMNPNNQSWNFNYIFGFASTSQMVFPDHIWIKPCNDILPVDLIQFNVKKLDNAALLVWKTGSEKESSHFIVERSYDAESFQPVGMVASSGNTSAMTSYSFEDHKVQPGLIYYRLKQVDKNGQYVYSSVKTVLLDEPESIIVFPNPAQEQATIYLSGFEAMEVVSFELINSLGQQVYSSEISEGIYEKEISLKELPAGIYLIKVHTGSATYIERIVKE
ncbi:MAG: T9SS type A sorting domain-containing protein [Cytophagaceae bacterium]|nr:T9SS type A sorting domain-containing protein [Cytophagaceae bacterium]